MQQGSQVTVCPQLFCCGPHLPAQVTERSTGRQQAAWWQTCGAVQHDAPQAEPGETQAPLQQILPPVQRTPQAPQLAASLRNAVPGSTQRDAHAWSPVGQAHRPRPVESGAHRPLSHSLFLRQRVPTPRDAGAASAVERVTARVPPTAAPSVFKKVRRVRGAANDLTMRSKRLPSTRTTFSRTARG